MTLSRTFRIFWMFMLGVIFLSFILSLAGATPNTRQAELARHHSARVHVLQVVHAHKVHAMMVRRANYAAPWAHISVCENGPGAWQPPRGPAFPDSLGITAANWYGNGGGSDLRPFVQARVAYRIQNPPPVSCPW